MAKKKEVTPEVIETIANQAMRSKTILSIRTKPIMKKSKKGLTLNDGYEFDVDGALPEIADGIAKFAKELPKNGFGEASDTYFITLIQEYFKKLK